MSLKEVLLARFGPLMTYADMAALFGLGGSVAADAMRQRLRRDKALGNQLRSCSVRLGRRTYFRADLVAAAISDLKQEGTRQGQRAVLLPPAADLSAGNGLNVLPASAPEDAK